MSHKRGRDKKANDKHLVLVALKYNGKLALKYNGKLALKYNGKLALKRRNLISFAARVIRQ